MLSSKKIERNTPRRKYQHERNLKEKERKRREYIDSKKAYSRLIERTKTQK